VRAMDFIGTRVINYKSKPTINFITKRIKTILRKNLAIDPNPFKIAPPKRKIR
jgi:hypothetical protein